MDTFRIVLLVRAGDAGPVVAELVASGYPLQRATSPGDAVRLAGMGPCFLIVDAQNAPKLGADTLPTLAPLVQSGTVRICLLEPANELPISPLVSMSLFPSLELDAQLEQLAQILWMNQRASPRAEVALHATFITTDGRLREGSVRSLSDGGALFVSLDPPGMGANGKLIVVDSENQQIELLAQVVNERKMDKGVGMRFVQPSPQAQNHLRRIVTGALGVGSRRASEHVLVVFDTSEIVRKVSGLVLGQAGYTVAECGTLPELMRVLGSPAAPAVLLLDPTSSAVAGQRLVDIVKRASGKTKVAFHTSAADDVVKKAMAATGVTLHIKKGSFADSLIARMGSIVGG